MNKLLLLGGFAINVNNIRYIYPNVGNNRVNIVYGDGQSVSVDGSLETVTERINEHVSGS
jgi:hypothetical protein